MRIFAAEGAKGNRGKKANTLLVLLRGPRESLRELQRGADIPWTAWCACSLIAVLGSLFFGFSLVRAFPEMDAVGAGTWFALSAGLAWIFFGPLLRICTGLAWRVLAQACLVTMVFGEAVLVTGAVVNLLLGGMAGVWSAVAWVGLSNLVMAWSLASQLNAVGIPFWRTVLCWFVGLNGLGAVFFHLLRGLAEART